MTLLFCIFLVESQGLAHLPFSKVSISSLISTILYSLDSSMLHSICSLAVCFLSEPVFLYRFLLVILIMK